MDLLEPCIYTPFIIELNSPYSTKSEHIYYYLIQLMKLLKNNNSLENKQKITNALILFNSLFDNAESFNNSLIYNQEEIKLVLTSLC